jgi:hypothetical protein
MFLRTTTPTRRYAWVHRSCADCCVFLPLLLYTLSVLFILVAQKHGKFCYDEEHGASVGLG